MIIARIALVAIALFGACAVFGALSVIMTLLFSPMDDHERDLADREQMEYLEDWRRHHE